MQSKWTNKKFRFYIFFSLAILPIIDDTDKKMSSSNECEEQRDRWNCKTDYYRAKCSFYLLEKKMKMRESRRLVRDILEQHTTTSLYNFNTTTETIMNNRRAWGNEVAISSFLLHISLFSPWRTCSLSHWESLKDPFSWEHGTTLLHCM